MTVCGSTLSGMASETISASVLADRIERIRQLHSPVPIPEGKVHMALGAGEAPCAGCSTGDPYLDEAWPCETRRIADGEPVADGVEGVQCGAVSERGDRCSLGLGHSPGHVATNAAGAPCIVWG